MTSAAGPRVLVIAGPTATGKSALALRAAEALNGVIVNADSIQCYRDLPILTARPTPQDEATAPHRLTGFLGPEDKLSAAQWAAQAAAEIAAIAGAGRLPMVVGGTGFYLKALMEGLSDIPAVPDEIRTETQTLIGDIGAPELHRRLAVRDPATAAKLKPGDSQRIARAWEVLEATDTPISVWQSQPGTPALAADYQTVLVQPDRDTLYAACDRRFLAMLQAGALDEVKALLASGVSPTAPVFRALGAAELAQTARGELALAQATTLAQAATRQYAKRQSTWFRHQFHANSTIETKFLESLWDEFFPEIRRLLLT
ncbi:MAG: tRNA (adenosine(37)-N6)-dimethylallyltransferase MiaA [Rhodospirillaceae bacterium]|nr:tRNA (adenosine(37)-N6)-dimethylallyltransferase MiaA [Rhodospirillaceae bacterium]